jgi:succinate dehydrogenase/fumarate reductase iron-sulfur protein
MSEKTETTYRLKVQRTPRNGHAESTYAVTLANPHARVLDALMSVRQEQDPTLGFRFSCRVGMCGSCAMVINGRERLACQTKIADLGTTDLEIAPLRSLPPKRDLTPDMAPFFDAMKRAHAALDPTEPDRRDIRTMPPDEEKRAVIEKLNGCITCGACYSACEWTRSHPGYLGPSALNRLYMLALDERDARGKERVEVAATAEGALRCHALGSCSAVCPIEIPLKSGMQRLKGLVARSG